MNAAQHTNLRLVRSHTIHRQVVSKQLEAYNDLLSAFTKLSAVVLANKSVSLDIMKDIHTVAVRSMSKMQEASEQAKEVE
jgi:hypothetical protein